jgi:hypothetical protein
MNKIGAFALLSGELRVTDPCYSPGTWCADTLKNVTNGIWDAFVTIHEETYKLDGKPMLDRRNATLLVRHRDHPNAAPAEKTEIDVGVDSGQAGFFCEPTYNRVHDSEYGKPGFYGTCCTLTCGDDSAGVLGFGAVSSSGWGDGGYDCFVARDDQGRIVAAKIVFIDPEADEAMEEDQEAA